jgi:hypothetical protein
MKNSRMYFFVPYNISDIQKGIQAGHAALEYSVIYGHTFEFTNFVICNKTWIILNGGTTGRTGTMKDILTTLIHNFIPCTIFCEPDLNDALTAICFICDEEVYDFDNYPDSILSNENLALRKLIRDRSLA